MNLLEPRVSICVLTFADYPHLAKRCINSICTYCDRSDYRLIVGANAVGAATKQYLEELHSAGAINELILSPTNLYKSPMMRLMFERVTTEFVWWFDDDSAVLSNSALARRVDLASRSAPDVVQWGQVLVCEDTASFWIGDPVPFVRSASWYRGLPPPFEAPGGKGEIDFNGTGRGDRRWFFIAGGEWFGRTQALRDIDWPDRRLRVLGEDVLMGEAFRQQGWRICNVGTSGVNINGSQRRWTPTVFHTSQNS